MKTSLRNRIVRISAGAAAFALLAGASFSPLRAAFRHTAAVAAPAHHSVDVADGSEGNGNGGKGKGSSRRVFQA